MTDITFNVLNLGQQLSGGKLSRRLYRRDPNRKAKTGPRMSDWQPGAFPQSGAATTGFPPVTGAVTSGAVTPGKAWSESKQEIANYIMNKAQSLGYSKDQAEAFVVQGCW